MTKITNAALKAACEHLLTENIAYTTLDCQAAVGKWITQEEATEIMELSKHYVYQYLRNYLVPSQLRRVETDLPH